MSRPQMRAVVCGSTIQPRSIQGLARVMQPKPGECCAVVVAPERLVKVGALENRLKLTGVYRYKQGDDAADDVLWRVDGVFLLNGKDSSG